MKCLTGILCLLILAVLGGCPPKPLGTAVNAGVSSAGDPGAQYWLQGEIIGTTISGPAVVSLTPGSPPAAGVTAFATTPFAIVATGGDPVVGLKQLQLLANISVCSNGGGSNKPTATWATITSPGAPATYQTVLALSYTPNPIQDMGTFTEVDYAIHSAITTQYGVTVYSPQLFYRFAAAGTQAHGCPV